MVFGNLLAIQQTNVKRMLAYSSIAHAGYLLVAVAAMAYRDTGIDGNNAFRLAVSGAVFYLFAYVFMTLGAFGVLIYLSGRDRDVQQLSDLRGLARRQPVAAYTMLFFLLSLGGIPPTMGFMGKWQIFLAALQAGRVGTTLAIVMALASVLAIYYYLKIVWMMCFDEPRDSEVKAAPNRSGALASIAISALATVIFGLVPYALTILTQVWQQVR
jgi:NADH-quinone oxidoreductase subunit N